METKLIETTDAEGNKEGSSYYARQTKDSLELSEFSHPEKVSTIVEHELTHNSRVEVPIKGSKVQHLSDDSKLGLIASANEMKSLAAKNNYVYTEDFKDGSIVSTVKKQQPKKDIIGAATKVSRLLSQGYAQNEIAEVLQSKGYTESQISEVQKRSTLINNLKSQGYAEEEIVSVMRDREKVKVVAATPKPLSDTELKESNPRLKIVEGNSVDASELLAKSHILYPSTSSLLAEDIPGYFFGNKEALQVSQAAEKKQREDINNFFKIRNVDAHFDDKSQSWVINRGNGYEPFSSSILDELEANLSSSALAVAGATAGATFAPFGPVGKFAASLIGGTVGGILGTNVDYIRHAIHTHEELNASNMLQQSSNALEWSILADTVGLGLKPLAKGLKAGTLKSYNAITGNAKGLVKEGNDKMAVEALRDISGLDDEAAETMVKKLRRVVDTGELTPAEEELYATLMSTRSDDAVKIMKSADFIGKPMIAKSVEERAKSTMAKVEGVAGDLNKTIATLKEDFDLHVHDTKMALDNVEADIARYNPNFKSVELRNSANGAKVKVSQVLTGGKISGAAKADPHFSKFIAIVDSTVNSKELVDLPSLIEIKRFINKTASANQMSTPAAEKLLKSFSQKAEIMIAEGAKKTFGETDGVRWYNKWIKANNDYSEMKIMQDNALIKSIFDAKGNLKAVSNEGIEKVISTLANSQNPSVNKLLEISSNPSSIEGSIINHYVKKHSFSSAAIDFGSVADDLENVYFKTPEAQELYKGIKLFSESFRNDKVIAKLTRGMSRSEGLRGLAGDVGSSAKYELVSSIYKKLRGLVDDKKTSNMKKLIDLTGNILERPLNQKTLNQIIAEFPDIDLTSLRTYRSEIIKNPGVMAKKQRFETVSGKIIELYPNRVANSEAVEVLARSEGVAPGNIEGIKAMLSNYGYKAIRRVDGRVEEFSGL